MLSLTKNDKNSFQLLCDISHTSYVIIMFIFQRICILSYETRFGVFLACVVGELNWNISKSHERKYLYNYSKKNLINAYQYMRKWQPVYLIFLVFLQNLYYLSLFSVLILQLIFICQTPYPRKKLAASGWKSTNPFYQFIKFQYGPIMPTRIFIRIKLKLIVDLNIKTYQRAIWQRMWRKLYFL